MVARARRTKPAQVETAETEAAGPALKAQPAVPAVETAETEPAAKVADEAAAAAEEAPEAVEKATVLAAASITVATGTGNESAQKVVAVTRSALGLWLHWWPEQLTDNIRTAQALASCRSVAEIVELQRTYMGSAIERWNRFAG